MAKERSATYEQIMDFLSKVVPGVQKVEVRQVGKKETLEFRQVVGANEAHWRFPAQS